MALTDKEKYNNRIKSNKRYGAYIPMYMANAFDSKLKKENINFTDWLKKTWKNISKKIKKILRAFAHI